MAAQIGQIDQTYRRDVVCLSPLEYRAEIRSSAALRLQLNRF
jgi:hypothetical protein